MLQTWYFATPRFGGVPAPPGQNITKGENPHYPIIYCSEIPCHHQQGFLLFIC